jgi:hypothetical protein
MRMLLWRVALCLVFWDCADISKALGSIYHPCGLMERHAAIIYIYMYICIYVCIYVCMCVRVCVCVCWVRQRQRVCCAVTHSSSTFSLSFVLDCDCHGSKFWHWSK